MVLIMSDNQTNINPVDPTNPSTKLWSGDQIDTGHNRFGNIYCQFLITVSILKVGSPLILLHHLSKRVSSLASPYSDNSVVNEQSSLSPNILCNAVYNYFRR